MIPKKSNSINQKEECKCGCHDFGAYRHNPHCELCQPLQNIPNWEGGDKNDLFWQLFNLPIDGAYSHKKFKLSEKITLHQLTQIKDFIDSLLLSQKENIKREIEGMKLPVVIMHDTGKEQGLTKYYNQAIDDILDTLDNK